MPQKNTPIFTPLKWNAVQTVIYKSRFIIALIFAALLLLSGCGKIPLTQQQQQNVLQQYFEDNILNRDFIVQLASDNGNDITSQYNGYTFKLLKNTLLTGPLTAITGSTTYTGSWTCNEDYSKLVISLPAGVTAFSFLNREWRFTKKSIPIMELGPWGTADPVILHMQRL
jgi:hypothetical protein